MGFDGPFHDGEAEAGAFDLILRMVFFDPKEALENEGEVVAGDSDSVVEDFDGGGSAWVLTGFYGDQHRGVGILLEGIFDQVEEELGPVKEVSGKGDVLDVDLDRGVLVFDDEFESFDNVTDAIGESKFLHLEWSRVIGFKFRDHQHVLHDTVDPNDVARHRAEHFFGKGFVIQPAFFGEIFEIARDDGERSAQLVGSVGYEVLSDLVRDDRGGNITHEKLNLNVVGLKGDGIDFDGPMGSFPLG